MIIVIRIVVMDVRIRNPIKPGIVSLVVVMPLVTVKDCSRKPDRLQSALTRIIALMLEVILYIYVNKDGSG
jgi:hypothetical protein